MRSEAKKEIDFVEWVKAMTITQFHAFCGTLFNPASSKFEKWTLWPGVRGYPGQKEMLIAFATFKFIWTLKARQLGGSEGAAFHAFKTAVSEQRSEILVVSKKADDAEYFVKRRVLPQIQFAYTLEYEPGKRFPWPKLVDNSDSGIVKLGKSYIQGVSSDNQEVRSRSPRLVVFDEIRTYLQKNAEELWSAICPTIEANPKGQLIGISTAKFGSWYNEMTAKIMAGKIPGMEFLFMPDDTDPQRTPKWRAEAKGRAAHAALFAQEHPLEPSDCFISREGAVFPQFDPRLGGIHVNHVELDWGLKYIIGYDHGHRPPAVLLMCLYDTYSDHLYVFDEVFCRDKQLPDVAYDIRKRMLYYKTERQAPEPKLKIADASCFNEDGKRSTAQVLKELSGIQFTRSHKFDIIPSIDRLSVRFSNGRITIDPRCEQTIKQVQELRYKREAGASKKEEIVDIEDDACFTGETNILMADGRKKAIKNIKAGDAVISHLGVSKASKAVITGRNKVYELAFSNGKTVRCTGSHPFLTEKGFKKALSLNGEICVTRNTKSSTGINITKTAQDIGDVLMESVYAAVEKCTNRFGCFTTENTIYQNLQYTIKTIIKVTIESRILNFLGTKTTLRLTEKIESLVLQRFSTNAENTTNPLLVENIQEKHQKKRGQGWARFIPIEPVRTVVRFIKSSACLLKEEITGSAQITASHILGENQASIILRSIVLDVENGLSKTNILRLVSVQKRAGMENQSRLKTIKCLGKKTVYNFSTEHGTYCVDGLIVSNCDILRYIDAELNPSFKRTPKIPTLSQALDKQARMNQLAKAFKTGSMPVDDLEAAWQAG